MYQGWAANNGIITGVLTFQAKKIVACLVNGENHSTKEKKKKITNKENREPVHAKHSSH